MSEAITFYWIIYHNNPLIRKTGAFFDETETDALEIFKIAIGRQNAFNRDFRFEPIIKQITSMDGFQAEQAGNYYFHFLHSRKKTL